MSEQDKTAEQDPKGEEYNVFRDSALRFMGYANEVGESFRYQMPKLVTPTYILAFGYCAADALTTGHRKWEEGEDEKVMTSPDPTKNGNSREMKAAVATFDTLLWQSFASVLIPGATINLIVRSSRFAMAQTAIGIPSAAKKWVPTFCGLGSIPFIVHPIDNFVDYVMDNSIRKWIKDYR